MYRCRSGGIDSLVCVTWLIQGALLLQQRCTWLICMCNMTHSYVWHSLFICVTWLILTCDTTQSFVCLMMCDLTHGCVWHDSLMCVTWLTLICVFLCVTRLIHMCEMTHSQVSGLRTRAATVLFVSLGAPDVAATFVEGVHEPQTPRDFTSRSAAKRP